MSDETAEFPWSSPLAVNDVPETGRQTELVADPAVRAATAKLAGLRDLPRLRAHFDVAPHGRGGLRVSGNVEATVGQTCVVTLEPIENEIDESVDLVLVPAETLPAGASGHTAEADDGPEPLVDGMIDLGKIATEFLLLAIDPYPRKPGAVFQSPAAGDPAAHPFAALAALKQRRGGEAE
jgi:uncharacterized metal-binding protein YceD (DUF177 family)